VRLRPSDYRYGVVILLAVILFVGGCAAGCASFYKEDAVSVTVEDKESIAKDGGHEYRVYTEDATYVVKDSIIKTRFASSDDYRNLKVGKTYDCQKFGWRIPFFSAFENLIDCREAR
jgi:hypothetical protein